MRITSLVLLLATFLFAPLLPAQTPSWENAWSYPMSGTEQPLDAALDAAGNIYVTSYLLDFITDDDNNRVRQLVISTSPDGTHRWTRTFLSGTLSRRAAMDADAAGNIYVAATFGGETAVVDRGDGFDTLSTEGNKHIMMACYNAQGRLLWRRIVAGTDSIHVTAIAATAGGVWIGGSFTGSVDLGETRLTSAGRSDVFLAMVDSTGAFLRAMSGGGSSTDECSRIAVAGNGDVVMLGQFRGTADFGGHTVIAGTGANFFVARWIANGTTAWAFGDGGASFTPAQFFMPQPLLLALDRDDNIYIAISFLGTISIEGNAIPATSEADAIILKYTAGGIPDWAALIAGDFVQLVQGVKIDTDGSIYVAGFSQVLPEGSLFLSKLSSTGEEIWQATERAERLGGAEGGPILIDANRKVYVVGYFGGTVRFGNRAITSEGSTDSSVSGNDLFIARIGSTSSVRAADDIDAVRSLFTLAMHDRQLLLMPKPGACGVNDAAIYSLLGERLATPVEAPASALTTGGAIRFDLEGLPHGAYLVVLRTERGEIGYRVVLGE